MLVSYSGKSRQSYYKRKTKSRSKRIKASVALALAKEKRKELPRLGTLKLYHLLYPELKQVNVGRDMFNTILKVNGLLVKPLKQYRTTTNSNHFFKKYKDLIAGMSISRPEQVWVSDITYISHRHRHYYLSLVTDAYSKRIMGYSVDISMNVDKVQGSVEVKAYSLRVAVK
ncbi:hypothetical protein MASR2M69_13440 [Bacteroidota bacterium]